MKLQYCLYNSLIFCFLFVISTDASVAHTAPRFTVEPKDATIADGKSAKLSCRAIGNPTPTYGWKRNGVDLVFSSGGNERLLSNGDLLITKFDKSYVGSYKCVVKVIYSAISLRIFSRAAQLKLAGRTYL